MKLAPLVILALLLALTCATFADALNLNSSQPAPSNLVYNSVAQIVLTPPPPSMQNATYLRDAGIVPSPQLATNCDYTADRNNTHYCLSPRLQFYFSPDQYDLSAVSGSNAWLPAMGNGFYYYIRSPHQSLGIIGLPVAPHLPLEMDYADPITVTQDLAWMRDAGIIRDLNDSRLLDSAKLMSNYLTNPSYQSDPKGWAADSGFGFMISYRTALSLENDSGWPQRSRTISLLYLPITSPAASALSISATPKPGTTCSDPWGPITTFQSYNSTDSRGQPVSCYQKNTALYCRKPLNPLAASAEWMVCDRPGTCTHFTEPVNQETYVCYRPKEYFPDQIEQCACHLALRYCQANIGTFVSTDKESYRVEFSVDSCRTYNPYPSNVNSTSPGTSTAPSAVIPPAPAPLPTGGPQPMHIPPAPSSTVTPTPNVPASNPAPAPSYPAIVPTTTPYSSEPVPTVAIPIPVPMPPNAWAPTPSVLPTPSAPSSVPSIPSSVTPAEYPVPSVPTPSTPLPSPTPQSDNSSRGSGISAVSPVGANAQGSVQPIASAPSPSSPAASSGWPSWATPVLGVLGILFLAVMAFYFRPQTLMAPPEAPPIYLSDTRLELIEALQEADRIPTDLSTMTGKSKSTVVEHLDGLVQSGLVERVETPGRKFVFYRLTHLGKDLLLRRKNAAQ